MMWTNQIIFNLLTQLNLRKSNLVKILVSQDISFPLMCLFSSISINVNYSQFLRKSKAFNKAHTCSLCLMRAPAAKKSPCFYSIMKHTKSIFVIYLCLPFHPLLVDRLVSLASCADVTSGKRLDSIHSWEMLTAYPA